MSYDFSKQITVFLITTSGDVNYQDCLAALDKQTIQFQLKIIKDVYPMSKAFQQMINQCKTQYFVEVDSDMILKENGIQQLFSYITHAQQHINKKTSMVTCMLYDPHLEMNICGVKIYDHIILKNYNYDMNSTSCEVEQIKKMENDGYTNQFQPLVIGEHSPKWTHASIFERYYNLIKKFEQYQYIWMEKLPKKLWDKVKKDPSDNNMYALLGAYTALSTDKKLTGEKDFRDAKLIEMARMESYLNMPNRATLYMTDKCNFNCEWCTRQHNEVTKAKDMDIPIVQQLLNKFPTINGVCICGLGCPFMSPNLKKVINFLKIHKKYVGLISNGSLITSKLDDLGTDLPNYISISLNAPNAEVHEQITKTKTFNTVIEGIKLLVSRNIETYLSYVCSKDNLNHIPEFLKLAKSLNVKGVHLHNILPHFDDKLNGKEFWDLVLLKSDEHLFDDIKKLPEASIVAKYPILIEKDIRRYCQFPWNHISVDGSGNVTICNSVYGTNPKNGNINDFVVWHNKYCCEFRDSLLSKQKDACTKCFRNFEIE